MTQPTERYKEAEQELIKLNLNVGDLEEYSFYSIRKSFKFINIITSILAFLILIITGLKMNEFDLVLIILGPFITYNVLTFISELFISCGYIFITPYRESDIENSLYALENMLSKNKNKTLSFLNKVAYYKSKKNTTH